MRAEQAPGAIAGEVGVRFDANIQRKRYWVPSLSRHVTLTLSARGDAYNTDGDPETFSDDGGIDNAGRFVPRATVERTVRP